MSHANEGLGCDIAYVVPCDSPRHADGGNRIRAHHASLDITPNEDIKPGCWARFAAWPLSDDNPPRHVDGVTNKGVCWLTPRPGWRTFARSFDLVVAEDELQAFVAAGGRLADDVAAGDGDDMPEDADA